MRKLFFYKFIFFLFLTSCSFDNKTGIWDGDQNDKEKDIISKKNLKDIFPQKEIFNQIIINRDISNMYIDKISKVSNWSEPYLNSSNNFKNFYFNNQFNSSVLSKKISPKNINPNVLFSDDKIIFHDRRGTIIVYSLINNQKIFEFNFYDKKIKNHKIKISKIVRDNFIYISDNLGYVYCVDLDKKDLIWAQNYDIPFFSNLKIKDRVLFLVNENNNLFAINLTNGEKLRNFFTDKSLFQTNYKNSIALYQDSIYLLNSNGNLYSLKANNFQLEWISNFKDDVSGQVDNLFYSHPITINQNNILISTRDNLFFVNRINSNLLWKLKVNSKFKPLISGNSIFLITSKNYIVCINSANGNILKSKNFFGLISKKNEKLKRKDIGKIIDFKIVQNNLLIITNKKKIIQIDPFSYEIKSIRKLTYIPKSNPIYVKGKIYFIDKRKRIVSIN